MKKAATDIYSFRELRENGFTYVGKCDFSGEIEKKIGISFSSEKRTIVDCTARGEEDK